MDRAIVCKEEPKVMQAEHSSNVFSLDFSCSSEKIISAGNDDQVIVHDISTYEYVLNHFYLYIIIPVCLRTVHYSKFKFHNFMVS